MASTPQSNNIADVRPDQALQMILASYDAGRIPIMLWGDPGVSKSSIVRQAAEDIGGEVLDFRLVSIESVDLRGYPTIIKDEKDGKPTGMVWVSPSCLPREGKGFFFLDELPQAPTMNQNTASELLLDRRIGTDYTLPEGWMVLAAGNLRTNRAGTMEVPTHLKNRMVHCRVIPHIDSWVPWAEKNNIHPQVIKFLQANPAHLHAFNPDALAFPTPRSWEFVSQFMHGVKDQGIRSNLISGAVSHGVAIEFDTFIDRSKGLPSYEDIIADPEHAPIGDNEHKSLALVGMVSEMAKLKDAVAIVTYFRRLRRELLRPGIHKMISTNPDFLKVKEFKELAETFGEIKVS